MIVENTLDKDGVLKSQLGGGVESDKERSERFVCRCKDSRFKLGVVQVLLGADSIDSGNEGLQINSWISQLVSWFGRREKSVVYSILMI